MDLQIKVDEFFQKSDWNITLVCEFLDLLDTDLGPVGVCGGLIRDLCWDLEYDDIDVVVDCTLKEFGRFFELSQGASQALSTYVSIGKFKINLWPLEETYMISTGHVVNKGLSSYCKSTFLRCNAALYVWRSKTLIGTYAKADLLNRRVTLNARGALMNRNKLIQKLSIWKAANITIEPDVQSIADDFLRDYLPF